MATLCMKNIEQTQKIQEGKNKEKKKTKKPIHRLITKRKRAKERRERITNCESPSL